MTTHKAEFMPSLHDQAMAKGNKDYSKKPDKHFQGYVRCNGKDYFGTNAVGNLCRDLQQGKLELYRGDKLQMTVENIGKVAKTSLYESKQRGFIEREYVPFPERR